MANRSLAPHGISNPKVAESSAGRYQAKVGAPVHKERDVHVNVNIEK
jgi:hypothetical protein